MCGGEGSVLKSEGERGASLWASPQQNTVLFCLTGVMESFSSVHTQTPVAATPCSSCAPSPQHVQAAAHLCSPRPHLVSISSRGYNNTRGSSQNHTSSVFSQLCFLATQPLSTEGLIWQG